MAGLAGLGIVWIIRKSNPKSNNIPAWGWVVMIWSFYRVYTIKALAEFIRGMRTARSVENDTDITEILVA